MPVPEKYEEYRDLFLEVWSDERREVAILELASLGLIKTGIEPPEPRKYMNEETRRQIEEVMADESMVVSGPYTHRREPDDFVGI